MIALINRIFIMVLLLSISGFLFSILYLPLEKLACRFASAKFIVSINSIALSSFVIPFYYIFSIYDGSSQDFSDYHVVVSESVTVSDNVIIDIHDTFGVILQNVDVLWFIGMVLFLLVNITNYIRLLRNIKKKSFSIKSDIWIETFEKLQHEHQLKSVYLVTNNTVGIPCTVGLFKKYIIIPTTMINLFDEEEVQYILKHELYHIAHGDTFREWLVTMLNCFNWFNPLFYFLKNNLFQWIEISCDEAVTKGFTKEKKEKYARLILRVLEAEEAFEHKHYYIVSFHGNHIANHKRRILKIMGERKRNRRLGKIALSSMAILAMFTSTVLAKEADSIVNKVFSENVSIDNANEIAVISLETYQNNSENQINFENIDFVNGNFKKFDVKETSDISYEIIYQDGNVSRDFRVNAEPRHTHKTVEVVISQHKKFSDGSCKTTYYEGKQCTVCGTVWQGDVIEIVIKPICTH